MEKVSFILIVLLLLIISLMGCKKASDYTNEKHIENVTSDVRCYLIYKKGFFVDLVPAIKEGDHYINLITMKYNEKFEGIESVCFSSIPMFNFK